MADGNAVAVQEAPVAPVVTSEAGALISMIERAARDPSVDIDKMERLFLLQERMGAQRAKAAYLAALAEMQPELPVIDKRGEISRKAKDESGVKQTAKPTKFARWEDVVEAITPIISKHGFSLSFRIEQDARVKVTAVLGHRDGHSEETSMSLGIDDSGAKNNLQGWGSSVSYGKRYTAFALLNIVARGEDDDGKAAGAPETINEEQAATLREWIEITSSDQAAFCTYYKVAKLSDLPAAKFDAAVNTFKIKQKKQASNG